MQTLRTLAAVALFALSACHTALKAPEPVAPPAVAPKLPSEPFGALTDAWKNAASLDVFGTDRVTRLQFENHFLSAFTSADLYDGKLDGVAPITETCKDLQNLCTAADGNQDRRLTLKEFLGHLDRLFDRADVNRDKVLRKRELQGFSKLVD